MAYNFDAPGELERYLREAGGSQKPFGGYGLDQAGFQALRSNLGSDVSNGYKTFDKGLMAINPKTGKAERVYAANNPGWDPYSSNAPQQTYFFESDPNRPQEATPAMAGGYSSGNDKNGVVEPLVIAGLAAMTGGALAPALAGATGLSTAASTGAIAGGAGAGIRSGGDLGAMGQGALLGGVGGSLVLGAGSEIGGSTAASGGSAAVGGTAAGESGAAAAAGGEELGGSPMWDWLDEVDLGGPEGLGGEDASWMNNVGGAEGLGGDASWMNNLGSPEGVGQEYDWMNNIGGAEGLGGANPGAQMSPDLWTRLLNGGKSLIDGGKSLLPALLKLGGSAAAGGSGAGMSLGDAAFDSTPFLLAAYMANQQRNDINPYIDRLNSLNDRFAGNESPYIKSLTDPYDMSTAKSRGDLTMSLGNRGVLGSSFGNNDLDNFGYMRDVGRGNLVANAVNQSVGAQSQLTDQAIKGVNVRNANTNALLGAGLNASARLFAPQRDPFGLNEILKRVGNG